MISQIESVTGGERRITINVIERGAASYAAARAALQEELSALQEELEGVKKRRIRGIKELAASAAEKESSLRSNIEAAPELFVKPKCLTLHGIKVGFRTAVGKIVFEDEETVIKLIRKYLGDREEVLIRTKENVNKDGLKTLTGPELAKIACAVEGAGDHVQVKATDSEVDKLVAKLITDMVEVILEEQAES